jgi:MFS family permease
MSSRRREPGRGLLLCTCSAYNQISIIIRDAWSKSLAGGTEYLRSLARALEHRNFRLFFAGQCVSLVGTWMQQVALGWLVYDLTDSPFWLGMVGFCGQIAAFFIAPVAGVLTDRWNLRKTLLVTQSAAMVQALILGTLDATGTVEIWQVMPLAIFAGLINAFDMPARQAFLVQMVDRKEDLANAIALNSSMVNGARLVGPSLAGILIATVGEAMCFLLNGFSYVAVILALAAMRVQPRPRASDSVRVWHGLRSGLAYAFGFRPIRAILLLLGLISVAYMPISVLMPVFATRVLHGNAQTLGFLTGASGVGALLAALTLASRRSVVGLGRHIAVGGVAFGVMMIAFSFSSWLPLSLVLILIIGFCMMYVMAASNTLLQTIVDEDKRGRVMGLYSTAFLGMAPIGSLLAGWLAEGFGPQNAVRLAGAVCVLGGVAFALRLPVMRDQVRPIYRRIGILPEIAAGIQASTQLRSPPEQ